MANVLFDKAREAFLCGQVRWMQDTIRAVLCSAKPDVAKNEFLSDLTVVATSQPLTGKTSEGGVAGASSTIFDSVSGKPVVCLVLVQDTGSAKTSRLLVHFDDIGDIKLPFVPNGGMVQINWPFGKERIFKL